MQVSLLPSCGGRRGGEGCFLVRVIETSTISGFKINFTFSITQHSRDKELMESLVTYFGCGRYVPLLPPALPLLPSFSPLVTGGRKEKQGAAILYILTLKYIKWGPAGRAAEGVIKISESL
jgi:hypothetical protein